MMRCFTLMEVFVNQKRVNVCEHTINMSLCDIFSRWKPQCWLKATIIYLFPSIQFSRNPLVAPFKNSSDAIFFVCSHTFALFWLRNTAVSVEIFWFCFRVFVRVTVHSDLINFWYEFSLSFPLFCVKHNFKFYK